MDNRYTVKISFNDEEQPLVIEFGCYEFSQMTDRLTWTVERVREHAKRLRHEWEAERRSQGQTEPDPTASPGGQQQD